MFQNVGRKKPSRLFIRKNELVLICLGQCPEYSEKFGLTCKLGILVSDYMRGDSGALD